MTTWPAPEAEVARGRGEAPSRSERFRAAVTGSWHVMNGTVTAALFDVDGTLVDSNDLHALCWWEAQ